jgi:hypothetical protein
MKASTKVIMTGAASLLGVALITGGAYAATGSLASLDTPGQVVPVSSTGPASEHASDTAKLHANEHATGLFGSTATATPAPEATGAPEATEAPEAPEATEAPDAPAVGEDASTGGQAEAETHVSEHVVTGDVHAAASVTGDSQDATHADSQDVSGSDSQDLSGSEDSSGH